MITMSRVFGKTNPGKNMPKETASSGEYVDYARDLRSGKIVSASEASPINTYVCPRPGCGGKVFLPDVVKQRPHFRHLRGEGTPACDEYFPGLDSDLGNKVTVVVAVEQDTAKLGMSLTQHDGRWGLGLRLPEIPSVELGTLSLTELLSAYVDVYRGTERVLRVSALDLRPGVGATTVDVEPSQEAFRTEPVGNWQPSIRKTHWIQECRGLDKNGNLFRHRLGEWTRLLAGSGVYHGESLMLIADERFILPEGLEYEPHAKLFHRGIKWIVREIRLPDVAMSSVELWLNRLGHKIVPRQWTASFYTLPRSYSEEGIPTFWTGDSTVIKLEAPKPEDFVTVTFQEGSNSSIANVCPSTDRVAFAGAVVRNVGLTRLLLSSDRKASLDIEFAERPSLSSVRELLSQTRRLRIKIGQHLLEAWQGESFKIPNTRPDLSDVVVDLGHENIRARLTIWEAGKRHVKQGLSCNEVAIAILEVLESADRIDIDAQNMGRISITPIRIQNLKTADKRSTNRLIWYDQITTFQESKSKRVTPATLELPRRTRHLVVRMLTPATLVRSRIAMRQSQAREGNR